MWKFENFVLFFSRLQKPDAHLNAIVQNRAHLVSHSLQNILQVRVSALIE